MQEQRLRAIVAMFDAFARLDADEFVGHQVRFPE
jgi:hypothetical protein